MAISSSDLSDNSKLCEGLNEMRIFLTCHLGVLFRQGFLPHLQKFVPYLLLLEL